MNAPKSPDATSFVTNTMREDQPSFHPGTQPANGSARIDSQPNSSVPMKQNRQYVLTVVAAGILPAVEPGILPGGDGAAKRPTPDDHQSRRPLATSEPTAYLRCTNAMPKTFLNLRKFLSHGWTPIDGLAKIRFYRCSSVVKPLSNAKLGRPNSEVGGRNAEFQDRRIS